MTSLRKLALVVILGLAAMGSIAGATFFLPGARVLVANDPLPPPDPPPIPWVI